jgi:rhodanese-related sulfurtransferase
VVIIDCRYQYEFAGGHIEGAVNHSSPEEIYEYLFPSEKKIKELMQKDSMIILHCEFSQCRAPTAHEWIRRRDRELNDEKYPLLFYPELYVLEYGYKGFYKAYPVSHKKLDRFERGTDYFKQFLNRNP